jgi:hypothetical protein
MPPAASPAAVAAGQEAGARDEIDAFDKAALFVLHRYDHPGQAGDVVAAAAAGEPRRRMLGHTDQRTVQVAVLVDLRATHKADIDIAALQQQQDVGAAQHHVGAPCATLFVGRGRQFTGLDEGADRAALEEDGEARGVQSLCQGRGQERNADAGEHGLAVAQQPGAHHRQQLARRMAGDANRHRCSLRGGQRQAIP